MSSGHVGWAPPTPPQHECSKYSHYKVATVGFSIECPAYQPKPGILIEGVLT